ncbi:acetoacetate decarboxylase family protein [Jidongwangia harbinensis]|uniref:acetoacetate decarboxylase family protein n=1 Tax=Jidongwangia harbinensis TaxID=2878561 RepID=UPI001CD97720|nr:acetoacetate decarboxylase family protein [Jidongwangia harbinensis]MCA2217957.1 acetoacetate decarboxylase family protein [Jidongwangia harbinensis]
MYPPEPWHLRGQMYLSIFPVPAALLPPLPAALRGTVRPVTVAGRAVVGAAWVRYEPGGTLSYRELLSAVLVHERGRPRATILDIWVDDVRSRDGGRELWGIPKELTRLRIEPDGTGRIRAAAGDGPPIAEAEVRPRRWPGRWPLRLTVVQELSHQVRRTSVRGRSTLAPAAVTWRPDPDGPLGYLAGRRPAWSVALPDFDLGFGTE